MDDGSLSGHACFGLLGFSHVLHYSTSWRHHQYMIWRIVDYIYMCDVYKNHVAYSIQQYTLHTTVMVKAILFLIELLMYALIALVWLAHYK